MNVSKHLEWKSNKPDHLAPRHKISAIKRHHHQRTFDELTESFLWPFLLCQVSKLERDGKSPQIFGPSYSTPGVRSQFAP